MNNSVARSKHRAIGRYTTVALASLLFAGCEDGPSPVGRAPAVQAVAGEAPGMCALPPEQTAPEPSAPAAPCDEHAAEHSVDEVVTRGSCCGAPSCPGPQGGCSCGGDHALCEG